VKLKVVKPYVRDATSQELKQWNDLIVKNPGGADPYQSTATSQLKAAQGWRDEYWVYETSFGKVYSTVLARHFPFIGKIAYIMRGPSVANESQLHEIIQANQTKKDLFAIKMEPTIAEISDNLLTTNFAEASNTKLLKVRNVQPHASQVVVDLNKDIDELWSSFHQGARREIRAAEKDHIIIKEVPVDERHMREMYHLYAETGRRAGFLVRDYGYYQQYWTNYAKLKQGKLFFAYPTKITTPIAGLFVIFLGQKAVYKDGGSIRSTHKHFAHLLQWEVMKVLKSIGIIEYNLMSTNTTGLANFKMSFAPRRLIYVGTVDQILNKKIYTRWRKWGEKFYRIVYRCIYHNTIY